MGKVINFRNKVEEKKKEERKRIWRKRPIVVGEEGIDEILKEILTAYEEEEMSRL